MNQMFPRAIQAIIAPSINIVCFIKIALETNQKTIIYLNIFLGKNTSKVARTVVTLANYSQYRTQHLHDSQHYGQINQSFDQVRQQQQQQQQPGPNGCLTLQQQQQTAV